MPAMPFKQVFERNMNENMEEGPSQQTRGSAAEPSDLKQRHSTADTLVEEQDQELSQKKDVPPRFSTLFGEAAALPVVERRERKSGVYIPTALFVLLVIILLFETTILFAYTVIGLYKNVPSGLIPGMGPSPSPIDSCNCGSRPGGININPHFIMGQASQPIVTHTVFASDTNTSPSSSSTSTKTSTKSKPSTTTASSSSSSTTSTKKTTNTAAAGASALLSAFQHGKGKHSTSTSKKSAPEVVVTTTAPQKTINSVTFVTVNPGQKTVTSQTTVPPPSASTVGSSINVGAALSSALAVGNAGAQKPREALSAFEASTSAAAETETNDGSTKTKTEATSSANAGFCTGVAPNINCLPSPNPLGAAT